MYSISKLGSQPIEKRKALDTLEDINRKREHQNRKKSPNLFEEPSKEVMCSSISETVQEIVRGRRDDQNFTGNS